MLTPFLLWKALKTLFLLALLGAVFPTTKGFSQEVSSKRGEGMEFDSTHIDRSNAPTIDGVLDDAVWSRANSSNDFHQLQPHEYSDVSMNTQFWIVHDEDHLYIAVRLEDPQPNKIVATQHIQGKLFESDDQLHISLDTFNSNRHGYYFQINPNGILREALLSNVGWGVHEEWETIWQGQATIDEKGWTAEIAIPFKSLSFDPNSTDWGFNIGRVIRRKSEVIAWASKGTQTWEMSPGALGKLKNVDHIAQGLGIDVEVSGVALIENNGLQGRKESSIEPSLDIFYKPIPQLTLSATVNTDFSATEIDDRIVNLTRFDVMFPEKRNFFLQDANLFSFSSLDGNGTPFFSRKVGMNFNGEALSINAGLKVTGRFDSFNAGVLAIRQESVTGSAETEDLYVVRATHNLLTESEIGFIYTNGNPYSKNENYVLGFDFNYKNNNAFGKNKMEANLWYQTSSSVSDAGDNHAFGIKSRYDAANYNVEWSFTEIGDAFDPAMGFVNRAGIQRHMINLGFKQYYSSKWMHVYRPYIEFEQIRGFDKDEKSENFILTPIHIDSIAGDHLLISWKNQKESLENPFTLVDRLQVTEADYEFSRISVDFRSSRARAFAASMGVEYGDFYDGTRLDLNFAVDWRPWSRLLLSTIYETSRLTMDSGQFETSLKKLNIELALTSRWAWLLSAQHDNLSKVIGINSRLRYMAKNGKELYLVFNKKMKQLEDSNYQNLREDWVVKVSYTWRF